MAPISLADISRSIPACAGEPAEWIDPQPCEEVYPRVCGGTKVAVGNFQRAIGLSPRVRGNLENPMDGEDQMRSIPACAGEPECSPRQY